MIDLKAEFHIALRRFEQAGCIIPGDLCLHLPALGLQAIEREGDEFYQPVDRGPFALLIPVYDGPPPSFTHPGEEVPDLIDLVAFRLSEPQRWWRRTGLAEYLGEHLIQRAVTWRNPLRVVHTPLAWLNARCQGVCPLGGDYSALRDPPALRFYDTDFAARVSRRLARPFPIPRIFIRDIAA